MTNKIRITLTKDFMEFDDGNGIFLCSDINAINVVKGSSSGVWFLKVYALAKDSFDFVFAAKSDAENFARIVCNAYRDFLILRSGVNTSNVRLVWE